MRLSAPKQGTFNLAVILFIIGLIGHFAPIPFISAYHEWIIIVSEIILLAGCAVKGF